MKQTEKEAYVFSVFEHISEGYDKANDRISLGLQKQWKKMLTNRLRKSLPQGGRMLDICCGTGDIAIALARGNPAFDVTGIDFSPAMLAQAREKGAGITNLHWVQGDVMDLPFKDESFDVVCISFGLRNTPDYRRVLREMRRILRPGGKVYCLDSFVPDNPAILPAYRLYFRHMMPVLGGGRKYRKQYTWLCQSTEQFPRRRELMKQFVRAGFTQVQSRSRMLGACVLIEGTKA